MMGLLIYLIIIPYHAKVALKEQLAQEMEDIRKEENEKVRITPFSITLLDFIPICTYYTV